MGDADRVAFGRDMATWQHVAAAVNEPCAGHLYSNIFNQRSEDVSQLAVAWRGEKCASKRSRRWQKYFYQRAAWSLIMRLLSCGIPPI
jgi:hypothetical protein